MSTSLSLTVGQYTYWCLIQSYVTRRPRKLGLVGGTFEDGSWSVYAVPDPRDVIPQDHDTSEPVYGKLHLSMCGLVYIVSDVQSKYLNHS